MKLRSALIALVMSGNAFAASDAEKIAACNQAYEDKKSALSLCELGVQLRTDEMARLSLENTRLREAGQRWYNNPWLWGAVGSILGVYAGSRAVQR